MYAHILSFPSMYFFVFTFSLVRHFHSSCRLHSFVLIARCPLLWTFSKQYDANEVPCMPFVLLMIFIVFPGSTLDLHTLCHRSSHSRWRSNQDLLGNVVLLGRNEWVFPQYRFLESDSPCEQESLAATGLQARNTGNERYTRWRGERQLQGNMTKISSR